MMLICWLFGHKLEREEKYGYFMYQCKRCYKYFDESRNEVDYCKHIEKMDKHFDKLKRPNNKWSYYFKKVRENHMIPGWYRCPECGIQYQSSPPSMDLSGMDKKCPECQ